MPANLPKLAVLASGEGSNLQAILDEIACGKILAQIVLVISDKRKSRALERARRSGIRDLHISKRDFPDREQFDAKIVSHLKAAEVDWVVLAGFMRILSPVFVQAYPGRILNIHPALLPKYPGIHSIERAYQNRDPETGVTVHFVDEGVDTGPIILQEALPIHPGESLEELTERVHAIEHRLYPEAIRNVLAGEK